MMLRTLAVIALLCLAAGSALSQPAQPAPMQPGGMPGMGMGGMMGPGGMPGMMPGMMGMMRGAPPTPALTVADGVVYLAFDGKLMAFDARTLEKIAEVTFWEPPAPPARPGMGPMPAP